MKKIALVVLLAATLFLRLYNLGYSDYIKDEHRTFYDSRFSGTFWQFALDQRKGPVQYIISLLPKTITGNYTNEFAQRLPFALANVGSIFVFYVFVTKLVKDQRIGLTAAALLSFNGFIAGFGRIAQYQNLNLLFSFLSLYFFSRLAFDGDRHFRNSIVGTVFLALSSLSHWDVVFIAVPATYLWIKFFLKKSVNKTDKLVSLIISIVMLAVLVLPFLVPYIHNQFTDSQNQSYLERRVGFSKGRDLEFDFLIKLYNPFISYYFYIGMGLLGTVFLKRSRMYVAWFMIDFLLFYYFAAKPGTHIYNFLTPAFILCAIGFWNLYDKIGSLRNKAWQFVKYVATVPLVLTIGFMFYQSFLLFVENKREYPWEDEQVFFWTAESYKGNRVLPLFGFPHFRSWKEIGKFIQEENNRLGTSYTYDTNEDSSNINFYTGVDKSDSPSGYFYVGIKRPISFMGDWKPKQIKGKINVKQIRVNGEIVAVVYKVIPTTN